MSDYKPGTLAVATVRGVPNVRVMRVKKANAHWVSLNPVADAWWHYDPDVTDVRPLVTVEWAHPRILANSLRDLRADVDPGATGYAVLGELLRQIESQSRPPKPAEPTGLGAVVEDSEGRLWVRVCGTTIARSWQDNDRGANERYHEIDVVRVLSDGWEPKP